MAGNKVLRVTGLITIAIPNTRCKLYIATGNYICCQANRINLCRRLHDLHFVAVCRTKVMTYGSTSHVTTRGCTRRWRYSNLLVIIKVQRVRSRRVKGRVYSRGIGADLPKLIHVLGFALVIFRCNNRGIQFVITDKDLRVPLVGRVDLCRWTGFYVVNRRNVRVT